MVARIGREKGRDRGRPRGNKEVLEEMRELRAHLEAMEMDRRRDPEEGDVSEPEDEEKREEVAPMQETLELRYFISVMGVTSRPRREFATYDGSLITEHLIDGSVSWISTLSMMS